jgi:hypothetical protein
MLQPVEITVRGGVVAVTAAGCPLAATAEAAGMRQACCRGMVDAAGRVTMRSACTYGLRMQAGADGGSLVVCVGSR